MIDRRLFLRWLYGTAAGVAAAPYLDVDRLLWLPGEKTIFLPTLPELVMCAPRLGISIRYIRQYDIQADLYPRKLDVFSLPAAGWLTTRFP